MSNPELKRTIRYRDVGLLFGIVLLAALLRLHRLDDESLWYDEVVSVQYLDAPSFAAFMNQERVLDPAAVPVYFCIEYLWWQYVSDSEYGLRLLSVGLGLMTIVVVWWLGRTVYSTRAGAGAALCTAFAQNQIYYSQEIRMYPLTYLLAALSVLALERAISRGGLAWWMGHWIVSALLVWTHLLTGPIILFAEGLAMLWFYRRKIPTVIGWSAVQCVYLLPLIGWMMSVTQESMDEQFAWIPFPTPWRVLDTFWTVSAGTVFNAEPHFLPKTLQAVPAHATATLVWCCAAWVIWRVIRSRNRTEDGVDMHQNSGAGTLLLALWCTVPILILVILSLTIRPCFVERYAGHCSLALFVLAGGGIDRMPSRMFRTILVLLLTAGYVYEAANWPRPLRPDLLAAVRTIERQRDGTEHYFVDNKFESGYAFQYYTDIDAPRITMGEGYIAKARARAEQKKSAWMLAVGAGRSARQYAIFCTRAGMETVRYSFPGRRRTHLVHATPKSP